MNKQVVDELRKAVQAGRAPGGCDQCNADQVMTEDDIGVFHLTVEHDDDCPVLRRKRAR